MEVLSYVLSWANRHCGAELESQTFRMLGSLPRSLQFSKNANFGHFGILLAIFWLRCLSLSVFGERKEENKSERRSKHIPVVPMRPDPIYIENLHAPLNFGA